MSPASGGYDVETRNGNIVTTSDPAQDSAPTLIGEHPLILKIGQLVKKVAATEATPLKIAVSP